MSRYHANTVWQSPDGTWNRASHPVSYYDCDESDECGDDTHEWCRQFDEDSFDWVSSGHATRVAAERSWTGVNPGGYDEPGQLPGSPGYAAEIEYLEDMAAVRYEKSLTEDAPRRSGGYMWADPVYRSYEGPPRARTMKALQGERNKSISEWAGYRLAGSAIPTGIQDREKELNVRIQKLRASASNVELEAYEERQAPFRDSLRAKLDKQRETTRETRRRYAGCGDSYRGTFAALRERDEGAREVEELIAKMEANASARAARIAAKKVPAAKKTAPAKKATVAKKTAPAKKAPVAKKTAPAARGKSTKKSTAGSFKTTVRPEVNAQLEAPNVDDLWS